MRRWRFSFIVFSPLAWLILATSPAAAEWFVDLYAGGGFTENTDAAIETETEEFSVGGVDIPNAPILANLEDVEIDDFSAFGLRLVLVHENDA